MYNSLKKLITQNNGNNTNNNTSQLLVDIIAIRGSKATQRSVKHKAKEAAQIITQHLNRADMPKLKDRLLIVWIVICFLCTMIMALVVVPVIIFFWIFNTPVE
jgi:hypothetical protein